MHQRQRFTYRIAVREGAEIFAFRMFSAAMVGQARMSIAAEKDKRIGFIIAHQHVIARLIELDVIMLEQQRFRFSVRNGDVYMMDVADQHLGLSTADMAAKVAAEALLEIFGFRSRCPRRRTCGTRPAGWSPC